MRPSLLPAGLPATLTSAWCSGNSRRLLRVITKLEPGQLVKHVAFWDGRIHILDAGGNVLAAHHSPQDVTALLWSGEQLLAGDADGRLVALRLK
jgi:hypothetical protein